jgi:hypothetical protein
MDLKPLRWQDVDALYFWLMDKVIPATIMAGRDPFVGEWVNTGHPMYWPHNVCTILGNKDWFEDF